jgi:hypothetical protein
MSVEVFRDDDDGFRTWLAQHPAGHVVNVDRSMADREGTGIYKASCFTIQPGSGGGDLQTESYIKVCSWDPSELDGSAHANLNGGLRDLRCQHCLPPELGLT